MSPTLGPLPCVPWTPRSQTRVSLSPLGLLPLGLLPLPLHPFVPGHRHGLPFVPASPTPRSPFPASPRSPSLRPLLLGLPSLRPLGPLPCVPTPLALARREPPSDEGTADESTSSCYPGGCGTTIKPRDHLRWGGAAPSHEVEALLLEVRQPKLARARRQRTVAHHYEAPRGDTTSASIGGRRLSHTRTRVRGGVGSCPRGSYIGSGSLSSS